jgi:hypothetical protein
MFVIIGGPALFLGQAKLLDHQGMVAHAFNPSTREAEAGGFLSSRPAWSTKWVPGQELYRETLSRKTKKKKKKALAAHVEALGLVLSTHTEAHRNLQLQL